MSTALLVALIVTHTTMSGSSRHIKGDRLRFEEKQGSSCSLQSGVRQLVCAFHGCVPRSAVVPDSSVCSHGVLNLLHRVEASRMGAAKVTKRTPPWPGHAHLGGEAVAALLRAGQPLHCQ